MSDEEEEDCVGYQIDTFLEQGQQTEDT